MYLIVYNYNIPEAECMCGIAKIFPTEFSVFIFVSLTALLECAISNYAYYFSPFPFVIIAKSLNNSALHAVPVHNSLENFHQLRAMCILLFLSDFVWKTPHPL